MSGRWLDKEFRVVVADNMDMFFQCYQHLAVEADDKKERLFKIRPKMHYSVHTADKVRATGRNPLKAANYMEEDLSTQNKTYDNRCEVLGAQTSF